MGPVDVGHVPCGLPCIPTCRQHHPTAVHTREQLLTPPACCVLCCCFMPLRRCPPDQWAKRHTPKYLGCGCALGWQVCANCHSGCATCCETSTPLSMLGSRSPVCLGVMHPEPQGSEWWTGGRPVVRGGASGQVAWGCGGVLASIPHPLTWTSEGFVEQCAAGLW
jgi:hypothetical protein